ncbi:MAG: hypothetical protein A2V98_25875 [Planctomycetes bacterium RBG_16_64_12]|nr:MAG: hypothetical protein A2V98_25875 [Planctomycetes bacterium RBG_16_64_12]
MALANPVGGYTLARNYLRASLAASTTFQTWTGSADAAAALSRIHLSALPPPAAGAEDYSAAEWDGYLPLAILHTARYHSEFDSDTGYAKQGTLVIHLLGAVAEAKHDLPGEAGRDFDNVIGGIIADLESRANQAGYLTVKSIDMPEEPERGPIDEEDTLGDVMRVNLFIGW